MNHTQGLSVHFELTDEQKEIQQLARRFARENKKRESERKKGREKRKKEKEEKEEERRK